MPSITQLVTLGLGLISVASALPNPPKQERHWRFEARQATSSSAPASATASAMPAASSAAAPALTDGDILQFALTLEHLESTFYAQAFQKFPDSDFMSLGLSQSQVDSLKSTGMTESTHVTTLTAAITQAGGMPVQQCQYDFGFTDAKTMLATARVLEAAGIGAYLGAAPLVNSSAVLSVAASIVTVEARHQSNIRALSGAEPVPAAFDTALGPAAVFTLAAPFITSCPSGSNLAIQAFPQIKLTTAAVSSNQMLVLQNPAQPTGAMFCAFVNQATPQFTPLTNGACTVPGNLAGDTFMMVTSSMSIADTAVLAGPSVLEIS
ncbi:hypothetical protein NA57DRAFT_79904 [Rhizodiscina lignyota]|uniref:Uncharacterized protein n=1 Tax=Rhizodiscina lignyota TaxID=1504668 RepID=A0A9P4M2N2_9PEZI|nr:hypothetical protein NA57DRAFT_79904 [Rhizodiscina lignyota]